MVVDNTFPHGHPGYLLKEQESALNEFRSLLLEEHLISPASNGNPPSHNDALLLRFLRARRFIPRDALEQFKQTERWRAINNVEDIYMNIDIDEFDEARQYYTHFIGRRDKRGMPVYLFDIGALTPAAMTEYMKSPSKSRYTAQNANGKNEAEALSPRIIRLIAIYENILQWQTPLSTILTDRDNAQTPITQTNNIVDISNMQQAWQRIITQKLLTVSSYVVIHPGPKNKLLKRQIVGAPSWFPMVWSFIKGLTDPITVSKIFILSGSQTLPTLSKFIEPKSIPIKYGGSLDFKFGDLPTIDPSIADLFVWQDGGSGTHTPAGEFRRWPKGPLKWIPRKDGDWDLLAVGSAKGQPRREIVATFKIGRERGGWADESMPESRITSKSTESNDQT